jgi:hypothetical protein
MIPYEVCWVCFWVFVYGCFMTKCIVTLRIVGDLGQVSLSNMVGMTEFGGVISLLLVGFLRMILWLFVPAINKGIQSSYS